MLGFMRSSEQDPSLLTEVMKAFPSESVKINNTHQLATEKTLVSMYSSIVNPIVEEYKRLNATNTVFGVEKCPNIHRRVGLIVSFLLITDNFLPIRWNTTYNISTICRECLGKCKVYKTYVKCRECGMVDVYNGINSKSKCTKYINESTYDAPKNFRKEISYIAGLSIKSPHINDDMRVIKEYLRRSMKFDITRDDIRYAMAANKLSNYCDINYIYHKITGKPLPNLGKHIDTLVEKFRRYYEIFNILPNKEGYNVSNNFLLELFLYQESIPYEKDWFKPVQDVTRKKHINNSKLVCKHLGDKLWDDDV